MRYRRSWGVGITAVVMAACAGSPVQATAPKTLKPCGTDTLWATHAASAESWDTNGDRFECFPAAPYMDGHDNKRLPLNRGTKLYSFGTGDTGVLSVDTAARTFTARTLSQEDDADWNGCDGVCVQTMAYDGNDRFYLDTGRGSRRVRMDRFAAALPGTTVFSLVYDASDPDAVNIFSLVKR